MKGRFFFDPQKKLAEKTEEKKESNSILLRKGRTEIHWEEEEKQLYSQVRMFERKRIVCHQKICQTDDPGRESIGIQAGSTYADFSVQVNLQDIQPSMQPAPKEDVQRRLPTDRLDWSMRETFDHSAKLRENEDLRWTINNNATRDRPSAPQPWNRQPIVNDHRHGAISTNEGLEVDRSDVDRLDMERRLTNRVDPERCALDRFEMERRSMAERADIERRGIDHNMDIDYRTMEMDPQGRGFMNRGPIESRFIDRGLSNTRDHDSELRADMEMRERERMEMLRERELIESRERNFMQLREEFEMRKSVEEMRNNFGGSKSGYGPGFEREISRGSPVTMEEDQDDLQIIEERGFEREPWKLPSVNLASFNNARGGTTNRGFRGGVSGFRPNY